jgi:hypothetical protein
MYLGLLIIGVIPNIGAFCEESQVYPTCFVILMVVHIIVFCISTTLWCKEYMIKEELVLKHYPPTAQGVDESLVGDAIGGTVDGTRSESEGLTFG